MGSSLAENGKSIMKHLSLWQIAMIPWWAFAAYWTMTWLRVKRTKTSEPIMGRLSTILPLVIAFELLFSNSASIGPLGWRFLPVEIALTWAGIAMTAFGAALAIWARYTLGEYWSARVTLKEGHRIIRSGPYRFVRHPIYTGMLVASTGTALVVGEWRAVLAVLTLLVVHSFKARREERLLTSEFGPEYLAYRRSTGFLFPRLWVAPRMDTRRTGS